MTRIKHITTAMIATIGVTAAFASVASAYTTPNAELNGSTSQDQSIQSSGYSSPNAVLSDSTSVNSSSTELVSTPNAVLGASDLVDSVTVPVTDGGSSGFDWGDALIGAAAALVVMLIVFGGTLIARRRRPVAGLSA